MLVQIITNHDNGAGLQQDAAFLDGILRTMGHTTRLVHIHRPLETVGDADLNIFLEVLVPSLMRTAAKNWIVPNSEWWGHHWSAHIPKLDRVLLKTHDGLRIWNEKAPGKTSYIGWMAEDFYRPSVPKELKFLHTAGKSSTKNTAMVIEAWKRYKIPYQLTVSAFKPEIAQPCKGVPNVRLVQRFTREELVHEVNSSQFFLMPSKYEGYGHAIHEALGCKAVVLTTAGPPMNSFSGVPRDLLIPVERTDRMGEARASFVSANAVRNVVAAAAKLPSDKLQDYGNDARAGFLRDNTFFLQAIEREFSCSQ